MQQSTNYQLAKPEYTDAADIAPISGNMDTIDTALNKARLRDAAIYDENTTYVVGMYCIYQDDLYRCNGSTTGAWDASKWLLTKTTEIMRNQAEDIRSLRIGLGNTSYRINSVLPDDYDEISTTYSVGDLCLYLNELYRCKATTSGDFDDNAWDLVTFDDVFERKHTWELFGTETADGTSRILRVNMPAGVNGIFAQIRLTTGATNSEFGVVVKTTSRHGLGDIANYISTSGAKYGLCQYVRDGNFYTGFLTQPMGSLQSSPNMTMRGDGFILDSTDIDYVEFRTNDTSAVIPSGSKFEIYVRK